MNRAERALQEIQAISELAKKNSPIHRLAPLSKLLVTITYIFMTVSFHQYNITGLFVMILYPVIVYQFSGIPIRTCFYKLRIVLPLVCAVGLFNPFLDRTIIMQIYGISISGGFVSMITLMMKGIFCLMASFLLIATTSIEEICLALRELHVPKLLTSLLLLTYRYVSLLLEEVKIMTVAYELRAPGQKGVHFSAWGSFLGQLLLRTMDRATALYESMELRGFHGEFYYVNKKYEKGKAFLFAVGWVMVFIFIRYGNLVYMLGDLII